MRDLEIRAPAISSGRTVRTRCRRRVRALRRAPRGSGGRAERSASRAVTRPVRVDAHIDAYVPSRTFPPGAEDRPPPATRARGIRGRAARGAAPPPRTGTGPLPDPSSTCSPSRRPSSCSRASAATIVYRGGKATVSRSSSAPKSSRVAASLRDRGVLERAARGVASQRRVRGSPRFAPLL